MISPNATRPSVRSSSRWYSTYAGGVVRRGGRRRGGGGGSGGTRHLPGQAPERLAAISVVAELVEAGTGRREQHGLPRAGGRGGGLHGGPERARALGHDADACERRRDAVRRPADEVDAGNRPDGDGAGQSGEVGALQR